MSLEKYLQIVIFKMNATGEVPVQIYIFKMNATGEIPTNGYFFKLMRARTILPLFEWVKRFLLLTPSLEI